MRRTRASSPQQRHVCLRAHSAMFPHLAVVKHAAALGSSLQTRPHLTHASYTGPPPDLPTPLSPRRLPAHFSASCRLRSLACEAAQASALRQEAFRETRISSRTRVRIRISNEAGRRPRRKSDLASAQILVQCYYCWCRRDYGYHITLLTASPAQPASSF